MNCARCWLQVSRVSSSHQRGADKTNSSLVRFLCLRHVSRAWTRSVAPPLFIAFFSTRRSSSRRFEDTSVMTDGCSREMTRNRAASSGSCSNAYLDTHLSGSGRSFFPANSFLNLSSIFASRDFFRFSSGSCLHSDEQLGVWHLATKHVSVICASPRAYSRMTLSPGLILSEIVCHFSLLSVAHFFNETRWKAPRRSHLRQHAPSVTNFNYIVVISSEGTFLSRSVAVSHRYERPFFFLSNDDSNLARQIDDGGDYSRRLSALINPIFRP